MRRRGPVISNSVQAFLVYATNSFRFRSIRIRRVPDGIDIFVFENSSKAHFYWRRLRRISQLLPVGSSVQTTPDYRSSEYRNCGEQRAKSEKYAAGRARRRRMVGGREGKKLESGRGSVGYIRGPILSSMSTGTGGSFHLHHNAPSKSNTSSIL